MTYDELFSLIRKVIYIVNRPSDEELQSIADELLQLKKSNGSVENSDLLNVVTKCVSDNSELHNFSLNTTGLINVAAEIIAKLESENNGSRNE